MTLNMKKPTIIAAIASVMLLAAPQQAEAQFFKKLGKAIGDTAKESWNKAKNAAKNNQADGEVGNSSDSTVVQETTNATDANNLNILGISLGQPKGAVESQLKAKGFKEVTIYDSKETQGNFYGKTAAVYVDEYDGKVTVSLRDVKSYTQAQAKGRVEQLKQQLQGNGTAKKWTGAEEPSYRIIQKGGKIEIEYHDEDEVNGDSGSYIVTCTFRNQDFTEE